MVSGTFNVRSFQGGCVTAVDARSARSFARHSHDEFGVGLMTGGAQRSWSGRGPVEAGRGNLITVNPGEVHDGISIGPERAWSMLYISPGMIAPVIEDLSEGRTAMRELHAPVVDDARAARLFIATRAAALDRNRSDDAFDTGLLMLFAALSGVARQETPRGSPRLARVRERIDDDPTAPHPLAELASLAGMSRYQTVRAFTRMTGLPPHAYVIQRRLDLARRSIRGGSRLADVAAGTGFADQSHLHRAFVARYGFTPGVYAGAPGH